MCGLFSTVVSFGEEICDCVFGTLRVDVLPFAELSVALRSGPRATGLTKPKSLGKAEERHCSQQFPQQSTFYWHSSQHFPPAFFGI